MSNIILQNSNVGFSSINFVTATAVTGTSPTLNRISLDFTNIISGIYLLAVSNQNDNKTWIGYLSWNSSTTVINLIGNTSFNEGVSTITGSTGSGVFVIYNLTVGNKYNVSLQYIVEPGVN
jgi:hypothetical protein